jgi:hypothetical protein
MMRPQSREVTYHDVETGDEVVALLPHKHEVCSKCDGHGTHLTPSIGNHAYSQEEFDEAFEPGSEEREAYFSRGGMYDVPCEVCGGKNVVLVVDGDACTTPEQKEHLAAYLKYQRQVAQDRADDARTMWYESGCPTD